MNKQLLDVPLPTRGINLIDDNLIAENEAADGTVNMSFKDGMVQTRKGYKKVYDPLATETGAGDMSIIAFTDETDTDIFYYTYTRMNPQTGQPSFKLVNNNGKLIYEIVDAIAKRYSYIPIHYAMPTLTYKQILLMVDGTKYKYFDYKKDTVTDVPAYTPTQDEVTMYGTNVLETTPNEIHYMKYIINDDNRVWVAGNKNLVRISHLQNPRYFPSNQVWKLKEPCTGMARFMGEVVLFTRNTTTLISGKSPNWESPDKYVFTTLPEGYGCRQHRTIAQGGNSLYWANENGIYRYNYLPTGYTIPECISEYIKVDGTKLTVKKWLKTIDWNNAFAVYYDNEYRLYAGNSIVYVFDTNSGTWSKYDYNSSFSDGKVVGDTLYYVKRACFQMDFPYDSTSGTNDGLTDDGTMISYALKSKVFDFMQPMNPKKFKKMFFTINGLEESYDLDLDIYLDTEQANESTSTEAINTPISRWDTMEYGEKIRTQGTDVNYVVPVHHKGKKYEFQYRIRCSNQAVQFTLRRIGMILKIKEVK